MSAINDLEERKTIWFALSDLFLDTDVTLSYDYIIRVCASSKYSIDELAMILKDEVAPACSSNLYCVAGEWAGFDEDWLQNKIIKIIKGRRTIFRKLFGMIGDSEMDKYTDKHWNILSKRIQDARNAV